jgi:serine/threonine-protein kinase
MGVVVAATHVRLGERRAIKMMRPAITLNTEATRRFFREAQAAAKLKSEHVAKVYDVDEMSGGVPFMVMEYLEGADLAAVLASAGALPIEEAVLYVRQACEAIAEAHAAGLVHRDLKPSSSRSGPMARCRSRCSTSASPRR